MKHFQKAHVFGILKSIKEKTAQNKVPYLELKILCQSDHGLITVWGKLFGESKVNLLKQYYRRSPNTVARFTGFFQQYIKKKTYHNFTFTDFVPSPDARPRAVIVMTGLCYWVSEEYVLFRTVRQVLGKETEENFRLYTREASIRDCLETGSDFKIKIRIEKETVDSEFMDFSGEAKPFICELMQDKNV